MKAADLKKGLNRDDVGWETEKMRDRDGDQEMVNPIQLVGRVEAGSWWDRGGGLLPPNHLVSSFRNCPRKSPQCNHYHQWLTQVPAGRVGPKTQQQQRSPHMMAEEAPPPAQTCK